MASWDTICPFLGAPAVYQVHETRPLVNVLESKGCGQYCMLSSTRKWLESAKASPQGLVNCAREVLRVSRENPDALTLWVRREESERVASSVKDDSSLTLRVLEDFFEEPVDHAQKPNELLKRFARRLSTEKAFAIFTVTDQDMIWARVCDLEELAMLLIFLNYTQQFIAFPHSSLALGNLDSVANVLELSIRMTVSGWAQVQKLHQGALSNKVFIAAQFKWADGEESLRQEVLQAIQDACEDCGYEADLVSQNHTGFITDRIIAEIKQARFVVAELTYNNRGAYFESGLARGFGTDVFHVIRDSHVEGDDSKGMKVHFDVQQVRHQKWSVDAVPRLREDLRYWIESTVGRFTA